MFACPICGQPVKEANINTHIDSNCETLIESNSTPNVQDQNGNKNQFASMFKTPASSTISAIFPETVGADGKILKPTRSNHERLSSDKRTGQSPVSNTNNKRPAPSSLLKLDGADLPSDAQHTSTIITTDSAQPFAKRVKTGSSTTSALHRAQPLAERMRPRTLDDVQGQELLAENGVLRGLIESDRIPSLILWGHPGTGKTTIARLMAHQTGARFIELNSTSTGVGELKKIFTESKNELSLTGRKTMVFCDEIHRFSKSQQDVFLGPVEAGVITLVGATTENPSFKVVNALLSRCRVFTLQKLENEDVVRILHSAVESEGEVYAVDRTLVDDEMILYLASFADGDARTALNLLELAMELSGRQSATTSKASIKASLTKTLVYDRNGDQHYDTISAFHKSVRGSHPHAALYYLARMLQSGEDPLYIARRMVVIASEDVGLADNTLLSLATATYSAAEKVGLPEARINLAHCAVALALAPKSTRAYRGLGSAMAAVKSPGVAGLPIPVHLRNAPTRLMKEMGYGREYKYNPQFVGGRCRQSYLPEGLEGREFLEEQDLGTEIDPELEEDNGPVMSKVE